MLETEFDVTFCAVFGLPDRTKNAPQHIVLERVPQPRIFQWNYRNHIVAESSCFHLDGVLCHDPLAEENDDGPRYLDFLLNARPLFIPQKQISAIVTSRLEKYRAPTVEWLEANGVKFKELIMLDLPSAEERRRLKAHAPFKASVYSGRDDILFVESNHKQARDIAKLATDLMDPLRIVWGGDGAFDQCQVVRSLDHLARCLRKVGDVHHAGDIEQMVLDIEDAQLATVTRRKLVDRQFR